MKLKCAFITLEQEEDAIKILKTWKISTWDYLKSSFNMKGGQLYFRKAPDPSDIIWENLEVLKKVKVRRRLLSVLFLLLFQVLCFFLLLAIAELQTYIRHNGYTSNILMKDFLGLCCFGTVSMIQNSIALAVNKLTKYQNHTCFTNQVKANAFNMTWMFFVSSALVPFSLFAYKYSKSNTSEEQKHDLFNNLFFIFLGNAIITPFVVYINIWYFYRKIKCYFIKRKGDNCQLMQYQANAIFEYPSFHIGWKYAKLTSVQLTSLFYAPMFPTGIYFGIITLLLCYWACKYDLIRKCSIPDSQSQKVHDAMSFYITIGPLIFSIGCLFQEIFINDTTQYIGYGLCVVLSFIFIIARKFLLKIQIMSRLISNRNLKHGRDNLQYPFSKIKKYFGIDYVNANPITAIQNLVSNYNNLEKSSEHSESKKKQKQIDEKNELFLREAGLRQSMLELDYYESQQSDNTSSNDDNSPLPDQTISDKTPKNNNNNREYQILKNKKFQDRKHSSFLQEPYQITQISHDQNRKSFQEICSNNKNNENYSRLKLYALQQIEQVSDNYENYDVNQYQRQNYKLNCGSNLTKDFIQQQKQLKKEKKNVKDKKTNQSENNKNKSQFFDKKEIFHNIEGQKSLLTIIAQNNRLKKQFTELLNNVSVSKFKSQECNNRSSYLSNNSNEGGSFLEDEDQQYNEYDDESQPQNSNYSCLLSNADSLKDRLIEQQTQKKISRI